MYMCIMQLDLLLLLNACMYSYLCKSYQVTILLKSITHAKLGNNKLKRISLLH